MSADERVANLERAFITLMEMARNHSERLDDHLGWINQLGTAQADAEAKIAALADSHIRLGDRMGELAAAQANSDQKIAALVDAQIQTEGALRRLADQQARTAEQLARTDAQLSHTSSQLAETNARIDRLAEVVERFVSGQ